MSGDQASRVALLLAEADAHRDAGEWQEAADRYRTVAALRPDAWPLLMKQGYCLREAGDARAALDCYRAAEALAPADPEVKRQIAVTLRWLNPGASFGRTAERPATPVPAPPRQWSDDQAGVQPPAATVAQTVAQPELAPKPRFAPPAQTAAAPAPALPILGAVLDVAFDVTDLLDYFRAKRTPTGIQRVQCGIVGAALRGESAPDTVLGCVTYDLREASWRAVPPAALLAVIDASHTGADTEDPAWIAVLRRLDELLATAPRHLFPLGGMLVNLGNSWGLPDYFRGLRAIQRERGVRYVPFLHDCVPLVVPEHCQEQMVRDYARWFAAVGIHAHGFLCNSDCTRRDGRTQLDRVLPGLDLPMEVVRLDADPHSDGTEPDLSALEGIRGLRPGQPYALFVGTIESRKDHLLVFRAWLSLIRRLGAERVPRLVCVGQPGWHAQGALELLNNSAELRRNVLLLHGISDEVLGALYAGCRFTVYNSFYEGWGLPVTESRAYGKVPVIPEHSALPEAGGPHAVYFAPQHEPDLISKLERMITDPAFVAEREAALRGGAGLRSWDTLKDEALRHLRAMAARPPLPLEDRIAIEPGLAYAMIHGQETVPQPALAIRQVLRDGPNWHMPEDWGVWTRGGSATLRLPLPPGTGGSWRLYLDLLPPPGDGDIWLRAEIDGQEVGSGTLAFANARPSGCVLPLQIPADGRLLRVEIESAPVVLENDVRVLGAGLKRVMLCREDDLGSRLGWLEDRRLTPVLA